MKVAFQMNALAGLSPLDSTLYLAEVIATRGYELFHYEPQRLCMTIDRGLRITATGHPLYLNAGAAGDKRWELGEEQTRDLATFDVLLMRQDPPFDLAYITATHILEHLKDTVKIINDPVGVRNAPEKLLITHFPHLMPPTLIARDRKAIEDFRAHHKDVILKPLHGYAGHGIFRLREGDDNLPALIETLGASNNEPWMLQKFLPIATEGDKRIVLLDSEPVGVFVRWPAPGEIRANMRVGGTPEVAPLTSRDREICDALAPTLRQQGLFLTGLDVIGQYLTEINVTSPTGLAVADRLEGRTGKHLISEQFWARALG
jgi:glutathione synthase